MSVTQDIGYWEPVGCGEEYRADNNDNYYTVEDAEERIEELEEQLEELQEKIEELEAEDKDAAELQAEADAIQEEIDALNVSEYHEVYQWYIVSDRGAEILEECGEILYYNETLDIYLWGVTHYGTSWSYVLTNIKCNTESEE